MAGEIDLGTDKLQYWKDKLEKEREENAKRTELGIEAVTYEPYTTKVEPGWHQLSIVAPNLSALDAISKFIDEVKELVTVLANLIKTLAALASELPDPINAVLQVLIKQLKETIEGLLEDVGIYILLVPFGKRFNTSFAGWGDLTPPITHLFPPDQGLNDPNTTPEEREMIINANKYLGGNSGFYRTVLTSLYDKGDRFRPQFTSQNDFVGGLVILLGTNVDPFGFLDQLWKLWGMFGNLFETNYITKIPRPAGLKAEALTKPNNDNLCSFLLTWDNIDPPIHILPDLGGLVLKPKRRAIIMGRNSTHMATAENVVQLFNQTNLYTGLIAPADSSTYITVIDEDTFNVMENSKVILDVEGSLDDTFYFALAWKLEGWGPNQDWSDAQISPEFKQDYWFLSNVAIVVPNPRLPASTPPDWVRSPSVAELFPDLAYFLRKMVAYIEALANRLQMPGNILKAYADFLLGEVERYENLIQDILNKLKTINSLFRFPTAGTYCREFFGQGGNQFFISDLGRSLSASYENAPPFHNGDEYVAGLVFLTGGPEVLVRSGMALLKLIFGGSANTEVQSMITSIGTSIESLEQQTFGDNLTISPAPSPEQFDSSFKSLVLCKQDEPYENQFGDDFSVKEKL